MNQPPSYDDALRAIHQEALYLDQCAWDQWLALYTEDCTFWIPSWRDESTLVEDPQSEISFLFADSRRILEERVRRITMGKSITTVPMPRTVHVVSNALELPASAPGRIRISSAWTNHLYDPRTHQAKQLFGRYEHELVQPAAGEVRIASKKVILASERVTTVLDIYSV
jgi:3-phenylpropionate/cinnamic acid dioxygenase small subunit